MTKYILLLLAICSTISLPQSKNELMLSGGYGYYLSNSENSSPIMNGKRFNSHGLYGLSYKRNRLISSIGILMEYSYHQITKERAIVFTYTEISSPDIVGYFYGDISLISYNIDLDLVADINNNFSFGVGPSFVINNRILDIPKIPFTGQLNNSLSLYDKLASAGIGLNAFASVTLPLTAGTDYFFFNSKIKFRYTHSAWFDEGIRNLDNYKQEFFISQLSMGIGYAF